MQPLTISILIPALNEAANIGRCIETVRQHIPHKFSIEIIVGDHGSQDSTASIASSLGARVCAYRRSTVGELRNFLVSQSSGFVVVFLDADVSVTPEWGEHIVDTIDDLVRCPGQVTGSLCAVPASTSPFIKYWFAKMPREVSNYLGTGHLITTRRQFDSIGGFDARLRSGEDFDFCMRARKQGAAFIVRPELRVVHHDYPTRVQEFLRRERWHGTGDFQSLQAIAASKVALLTLAFLVLNSVMLFLLLTNPFYALVPLMGIVVLLAAASLSKFKGLNVTERIYNIGIFFLYFVGRSLSAFSGLNAALRPRQT